MWGPPVMGGLLATFFNWLLIELWIERLGDIWLRYIWLFLITILTIINVSFIQIRQTILFFLQKKLPKIYENFVVKWMKDWSRKVEWEILEAWFSSSRRIKTIENVKSYGLWKGLNKAIGGQDQWWLLCGCIRTKLKYASAGLWLYVIKNNYIYISFTFHTGSI